MGPMLLIDKSAFQSLSVDSINFLFKYYTIIVPKILLIEIVADLRKYMSEEEGKKRVSILAYRMDRMDVAIHQSYEEICIANLMGRTIPMEGRPVISGASTTVVVNGRKEVIIDEAKEIEFLRKWQMGNFTEDDYLAAEEWRSYIKTIDLDLIIQTFPQDLFPNRLKDLNELTTYTRNVVNNSKPDMQLFYLIWWMNVLGLHEKTKEQVLLRWKSGDFKIFKEFAPYAYYCLYVTILFIFGVAQGLLGTKATNLIDLEYVYYLPFVHGFTSGDKFHQKISSVLIESKQLFVPAKELKIDLDRMATEWELLSQEQKVAFNKEYGQYPRPLDGSVTCALWDLCMRPRKN